MLCPDCFLFTCDDTREIEAGIDFIPAPEQPIECAVVTSHWGDVMATLCHIKAALDARGQQECDVLYWGKRTEIASFIADQPFVSSVYVSTEHYNYQAFLQCTWLRSLPRTTIQQMLPKWAEFDRGTAYIDALPHVVQDRQFRYKPFPFTLRNLAWSQLLEKVQSVLPTVEENTVLLHPFSTWSSGVDDHWPHWREGIEWLLENTDRHYVLTGLVPVDIRHPRLTNLVGKLSCNEENLALSVFFPKVMTTSNSVSIFTACHAKAALVMANGQTSRDPWNPYRRLIDREPHTFLTNQASVADFQTAALAYLAA